MISAQHDHPLAKNALSDWATIVLCAVMVFLLALSQSSFGQCTIDSAGWLYGHPYFEGRDWKNSGRDSLDLVLDNSVCLARPALVEMAATPSAVAAVLADSTGFLTYYLIGFSNPQCACCRPTITISTAPAILPVVMPAGGSMHLMRQAGGIGDTMLLAVSTAVQRVLVRYVRQSNFSLVKTDTLALSSPPAVFAITGVWGTAARSAASDTGLWVTGTAGVIRYFGRTGGAWAAEKRFDITGTEDVTALGQDVAGCASGSLYGMNAGRTAFAPASRPCSTAIRTVSTIAVAADSGRIAVRIGGIWRGYRTGAANLARINLVKLGTGSGAELLDTRWRYSSYAYSDTATTLADIRPASVKSHLNGTPYVYGAALPETVSVVLADIDSNFTVPRIVVKRSPSDSTVLLGPGIGLQNSNPSAPCSVGVRLFTDTLISVVLRPDSVIVLGRSAAGAFDFSCYECFWQRQTFRAGTPWSTTASAVVTLGSDVLQVNRSGNTPTVMPLNLLSSDLHDISVRPAAGAIRIDLSPRLAAELGEIRLFSPDGRLISRLVPGPVLLTPKLASGMVYVQFVLRDGRTIARAIPITR